MSNGPSRESSRRSSRRENAARSRGDPTRHRADSPRGWGHGGGAGGEGRRQGPGQDQGRGDQGARGGQAPGAGRTRKRGDPRVGSTGRFDGGGEGWREPDGAGGGGCRDRRLRARASGREAVAGGEDGASDD